MKTKIYIAARQIHRLLMFVTIMLFSLMGSTGVMLKYSTFFSQYSFINLGLMRGLHNYLSAIFVIELFFVMLTGIYLYIFPLLKK